MPVDKNHRLIAVFDMGKPAKVMGAPPDAGQLQPQHKA